MRALNIHNTKQLIVCLALSVLSACGGDEQAPAGCSATENSDGSVTLVCGDDAPVTLRDPRGADGTNGMDGTNGADGTNGMDGANGQNAAIRVEGASAEQCAYGGEVVYTGVDANGSGALEQGEETQSFIICQGAPGDGKTALVVSSPAAPEDCAAGGHRVEVGLDADQSGTLDAAEVLDTFNVCDGEQGAAGPAGYNALIEVTVNGALSCSGTGDAVRVGVDADANGALSAAETTGSFEVCDGQDGASCSVVDHGDGTKTLSCSDGTSVTIANGTDGTNGTNGMDGQNGTNGTNGANGMNGQDGLNSLIKLSAEPSGVNCPVGGQRVEVGLDQNRNGTLDTVEIDHAQTSYLCLPGPFKQVSTGGAHTCAVTTTGGLKCWGFNIYGQLGDGTTTNRATPVDVIGLTSGVMSVSVGNLHTCALTTSGGVKCWGYNNYGQLGNATFTQHTTPADVSGLTSGVASISTIHTHSCAVTTTGGVKCWGRNNNGQLGDGTTTNRATPVDVIGLTSGVASISAGTLHTCAMTASGDVKCWGYNNNGQLGDGTTTQRTTPVDVIGLASGVASVSAGAYHTCAMTTAGGLKCLGNNDYGQLGDGTTTNRATPVDVNGLTSGVVSVLVGNYHNCALTTSGGVKCWGSNTNGKLGDGTFTNRATPVDVSGLTSGVASVSAGGTHTCAVTTAGGVKCWGHNNEGQLGDGTTTQRLTPVAVLIP